MGPNNLKQLITKWFKDHPTFAGLPTKAWCKRLTSNDHTTSSGAVAWSNCPLSSDPACPRCLLSASLAALGSSALPERGPATGRPATALGAQASCLQGATAFDPVGRSEHGQSARLGRAPARPLRASRARAWHSQGEAQPLGAPPPPRVLERAASKVADSTAFDPVGAARWPSCSATSSCATRTTCGSGAPSSTRARPASSSSATASSTSPQPSRSWVGHRHSSK